MGAAARTPFSGWTVMETVFFLRALRTTVYRILESPRRIERSRVIAAAAR